MFFPKKHLYPLHLFTFSDWNVLGSLDSCRRHRGRHDRGISNSKRKIPKSNKRRNFVRLDDSCFAYKVQNSRIKVDTRDTKETRFRLPEHATVIQLFPVFGMTLACEIHLHFSETRDYSERTCPTEQRSVSEDPDASFSSSTNRVRPIALQRERALFCGKHSVRVTHRGRIRNAEIIRATTATDPGLPLFLSQKYKKSDVRLYLWELHGSLETHEVTYLYQTKNQIWLFWTGWADALLTHYTVYLYAHLQCVEEHIGWCRVNTKVRAHYTLQSFQHNSHTL